MFVIVHDTSAKLTHKNSSNRYNIRRQCKGNSGQLIMQHISLGFTRIQTDWNLSKWQLLFCQKFCQPHRFEF